MSTSISSDALYVLDEAVPDRWAKLQTVGLFVGGVLLLFGLCAAFGTTLLVESPKSPLLRKVELPLGRSPRIAADSAGQIYLASTMYDHVQLYDANGKFVQNWYRPCWMCVMVVAPDNKVHLIGPGHWHYVLNPADGFHQVAGPARQPFLAQAAQTERSPRYAVRHHGFVPHAVRYTDDGAEETVVRTPLWLWPVQGYGGELLFIFLGIGLIMLGRSRILRY